MPRPADDKNRQGRGQQAAAGTPPAASTGARSNPAGGTPPAPPTGGAATPPVNTPSVQEGNSGGEAAQQQQGGTGTQGETSPATGDNKPPVPPAPPTDRGGKKRVKCESLKGKKVIVGKGEVVQIDENGFFEVEAEEAERLLTIPGYEEA